MKNHEMLLDKCQAAFWKWNDHSLSDDRRLASVLKVLADDPLLDRQYLAQIAHKILMPDIAMCQGGECPVRENCWRHIAPADRWQSYFGTPPFDEDGCEYFWDVNEK